MGQWVLLLLLTVQGHPEAEGCACCVAFLGWWLQPWVSSACCGLLGPMCRMGLGSGMDGWVWGGGSWLDVLQLGWKGQVGWELVPCCSHRQAQKVRGLLATHCLGSAYHMQVPLLEPFV